jgi:peptidyl-prolyl cis-trans isomerase B (cyclophilin B)
MGSAPQSSSGLSPAVFSCGTGLFPGGLWERRRAQHLPPLFLFGKKQKFGSSSSRTHPGSATILGCFDYLQTGFILIIRLTTTKGDIDIALNEAAAPKTCANFVKYVREGFYNGTIFHRVIPRFMIQGGGLEPGLKQKKTRAPIENEATNGLKNNKYTIAMARTNDPHSATSQFFINVADNTFLNHTGPSGQGWGYAVFGEVVKGKSVVDAISITSTGNRNFYSDVPLEDIVIEKAEVLPDAQ